MKPTNSEQFPTATALALAPHQTNTEHTNARASSALSSRRGVSLLCSVCLSCFSLSLSLPLSLSLLPETCTLFFNLPPFPCIAVCLYLLNLCFFCLWFIFAPHRIAHVPPQNRGPGADANARPSPSLHLPRVCALPSRDAPHVRVLQLLTQCPSLVVL